MDLLGGLRKTLLEPPFPGERIAMDLLSRFNVFYELYQPVYGITLDKTGRRELLAALFTEQTHVEVGQCLAEQPVLAAPGGGRGGSERLADGLRHVRPLPDDAS